MLKVSLDVDGTIVDWINHYISKFGVPNSDEEITQNVEGVLINDKEFWLTQPLINTPNFIPKCYCTARLIKKSWIKKQIEINNLPKAPIYQVKGYGISKLSQLKKSGAQVHIDDSISVFKDLNSKGFPCLLITSPENKHFKTTCRINSLNYQEIEQVYNQNFKK